MDHGKARDSHKPRPIAIDLGNEPPLSVDGGLRSDFDRRRDGMSVREELGTRASFGEKSSDEVGQGFIGTAEQQSIPESRASSASSA